MNLAMLAVGRAKHGAERDLFEDYRKRLPWKLDLIEVEEKRPLDAATLRQREAELLLGKVPDGALVVALDQRGQVITSERLSQRLIAWRDAGKSRVCFLIGGATGHGDAVRERADFLFSLGNLTWPHMLVRAMLAEQLYRAWSISANHPYHRAG
ncbi:23S rRNA (pseudouridine(1915)-N(3))-methyltransferase RlmH [Emcibacter sp. SYSU 3D8]|uniref:23S rRNA (pseudouridine(1915)-N(3))-methyltransferase RlmH n=1 Tax=Emcibacter sp. SYSU 3D8 TaxID=3133969 RepID=UPI0031FF39AC